jgi:hypothetical protein
MMSASASKLARIFDRRTDLTRREERTVREFVARGKTIEKFFNSDLLALGIKVKAIFASKVSGIPVLFDGYHYLTFDIFVEANFPICARTMRRWLAEQGQTDQRFSNKPKPLPESVSVNKTGAEVETKSKHATMKAKEARIKSATGYPRGKTLPRNVVNAYDAGYRQGYDDGLADAQNRKGLA